jgi:hypothetical protein
LAVCATLWLKNGCCAPCFGRLRNTLLAEKWVLRSDLTITCATVTPEISVIEIPKRRYGAMRTGFLA